MLGTRWFEGMRLNYARHLLRFDDDEPAIIAETETRQQRALSHRELRAHVARCAAAMRADGVKAGDRVAAYMPNIPETIVAMLATASIGAIWSSCSPDFGAQAVVDRFGQIEPKVLFATDGYTYGGKVFSLEQRHAEIIERIPSIERLVLVPFVNAELLDADQRMAADQTPPTRPAVGFSANAELELGSVKLVRDGRTVREYRPDLWGHYLRVGKAPPPLAFEEVLFDHPLFIMYSSGTTGVPKCIVHGHGGTLLQHMKELMLHTDLRGGERIFYFTTCGWMMWNWLVSGLGCGAALVLYEGNPAYPDAHRLWELAERTKLHVFGTSPKFLGACQKAGIHPGRDHDLSALRCVCSTGSPLSEELFAWVYREVKGDLQLSSISGGTDIISCFMLGNPLLPVHAGEIQCRGLGMDVRAWDDDGREVINQKGELVCTSPFPSQPVCFWNDPGQSKYRGAYFDHFPGVWRHGDYIEITDTGGVIVYGRSDATLNPGGVRIGTAEIYRCVEALPEVLDSLACGREADDDVEICLFVVLRPGLTLDAALKQRIREAIAAGASKRHVPRHIAQVSGIPVTISGKKVELAVQKILHGEAVTNRDALANPEVLDEFRSAIR
ncbi:MAG: acetoacetate--CoA ligase [Phycisphaerae bacterium]|nr:acetoacetate--CoA ligase [Phycisphaerae bacterium]